MKPLFTELEFQNAKSTDKLPCQCYGCNEIFYEYKKMINFIRKHKKNGIKYCSNKCQGILLKTKTILSCANCNSPIEKTPAEIKKSKSGNHFCSRSCAAIYNNTHKTKGNRISKLEKWLKEKLIKLYPNLEIQFNNKNIINSELDIYIPNLKLAFELNGIFHYEPIFGKEKLSKIQNNDQRKFQACLEQGIELCIIDTSQQKYFKEKSSQKYLNIINNIIKNRLII